MRIGVVALTVTLLACGAPPTEDAGPASDASAVDGGPLDAGPPPEPLDCDDPALWDEPVVRTVGASWDLGCTDLPPVAIRTFFPNNYPDDASEWVPQGVCWRVTEAPPDSGWEVGDTVWTESYLSVRLLAQESPDAQTVFEGRIRYRDGTLRAVERVSLWHPVYKSGERVEGEPLAVAFEAELWASRTRVRAYGTPPGYLADVLDAAPGADSLVWIEQRRTGRMLVLGFRDGLAEHPLPDGANVRLFEGLAGALVDDTLWLVDADQPDDPPREHVVGEVEEIVRSYGRVVARRGDRVFAIDSSLGVSDEVQVPGLTGIVVGGRGWAHVDDALVRFGDAFPPELTDEQISLHPDLGEPRAVGYQVVHGSGGWQHYTEPEVEGPTFFAVDRTSSPPIRWTAGSSYIFERDGITQTGFSHLNMSCD